MWRLEVYDVAGYDWILVAVETAPSAYAAALKAEHHRRNGRAVSITPAVPLEERRRARERSRDAARR